MKRNRVDKVELNRRLFTIQGWIVEGVQSALIIRQILENKWCESTRHAERLLSKARDLWIVEEGMDVDKKRKLKIIELQQVKRNLKDLYKGTPAGIRAIMAVEKEIIMLEGLRKPTHVALTDPDGNPIEWQQPVIKVYTAGPPLAGSEEEING